MCDQHSNIVITTPNGELLDIDGCIADLVDVLNQNGYPTVASCCGHGTHYGSIALEDGRWVLLVPDADFRAMDTRLDPKEPT